MLKRIVVGAAAVVLAGGAFMTAQALSTPSHQLPKITAPLTVQPTGPTATGQATSTPSTPTATRAATCGDDDAPGAPDRHGRGTSGSGHGCDDVQTVMPPPTVVTPDDHGRHSEAEPGDDHGGSGETEPGDDHGGSGETEPGDDHGGSGETEPGDDHGGSGGTEPGDDHGGSGGSGESESGDDHGGRG